MTAVDAGDTTELRERAERLAALGVDVMLGVTEVTGAYDLAIASPGVPPHAALMLQARQVATEVISEIEFAYRRSSAPWIAITGTNGKTTVTSLIGHLVSGGGIPAAVVGNIGPPAILAVDEIGTTGVLVAEVSSFQLALADRFHPRVSVLLNVTPDHLDWHGDMATYAADKGRVFARQTPDDTAVIDADDEGSSAFISGVRARGVRVVEVSIERVPEGGAGLDAAGMLVLDGHAGPVALLHRDELLIRGDHNVSNALAAAAAAHAFGVAPDAIRAGLRSFVPIEHRLEPVAAIGDVEYFNDSKATNPDAAIKAVRAFADRPIVVLLGGRNKGSRFDELAGALATHGASAVVFGEAAGEIARDLEVEGVPFERAADLPGAVAAASRRAPRGGAVVLSPACASFDAFSDYAHRGREFRRLVREMAGAGHEG